MPYSMSIAADAACRGEERRTGPRQPLETFRPPFPGRGILVDRTSCVAGQVRRGIGTSCLCVLAVCCLLLGSATHARTPVVLEVQNGPFERFQEPVSVTLGQVELAAVEGQRLVELSQDGAEVGEVLHTVVPGPGEGEGTLCWSLSGITGPGVLRRYAFSANAHVGPRADVEELALEETETHLTVANTFYRIRHPKRGGGGFPDSVEFVLSGNKDTAFRLIDRLYRRETRRQYFADTDPTATARVVAQGPACVVIEARTRFVLSAQPAPGNPTAVYRYTYRPFSPVVEVTCSITREDESPWDEVHFLELSREDLHYTAFVLGDPPVVRRMSPRGAKSKPVYGRHWGVLATEDDAVGVGLDAVTGWDASDEFVYYLRSACVSWTSRERTFVGALYVGPSAADLSWYSRWLGPERHPRVTALTPDRAEFVAVALSDAPLAGAHELANDALRLVFADADRGFDCVAVVNRIERPTRFVHARDGAPGLWRLEFREPALQGQAAGEAGEPVIIDNHAASRRQATRSQVDDGQMLQFDWLGIGLPGEENAVDVHVQVRIEPGLGVSRWSIQLDNRSSRFGLWEAQFPYLATVCRPGTADAVLPGGNWGGRLLWKSRSGCNADYPSTGCPMQFMAFNLGANGLYLGAHDASARAKRLVVSAEQDATFATYAEGMGQPKSRIAAPFPVVIAGYHGDWWEAARLYRNWATEQVWTRKGWISDRDDIPLRFKELGLWMLGGGMPNEVREWMLDAEAAFPLSVGLHWYNWHEIPFDHSYPEYFPTKPGFGDVVRELTGRGQVMMPYINGRLWDSEIPSFEAGRKSAAKQPNGDVYIEVYGSKRRLSPMCPATALWQEKVNEIANRLIGECGVNAIYLDQIGAARPRRCFDPTHGHPLGGGRHWVDGYRKMLDGVKAKAVAGNVALTTENTAEPYMDNIDGFLTWITRYDTDVPLLPAVYSGYTIYFSSPQSAADDLKAFTVAQGRDFLWGCQLGWNGTWILDEKHREHRDFFAALCQYRLAAKDCFVYGQLLDEIRPINSIPRLTCVWNRTKTHNATLPAVMGTLWRSRARDALVAAMINFGDDPQRIDYSLPVQRWIPQGEADGRWLVSRVTPTRAAPLEWTQGSHIQRHDMLAPREVRLLRIESLGLSDAVARAEHVVQDNGADAASRSSASAFLFNQAAAGLSLDITYPPGIHTVARGEPLDLRFVVKNGAKEQRNVGIDWPHGEGVSLTIPPGSSRSARRFLWVDASEGWTQLAPVLTLGEGGPSRAVQLHVRVLPPIAVTLGSIPQIRGGESFVLPVDVVNNSRSSRRAVIELDVPEGWTVEPGIRTTLSPFGPQARRAWLVKCHVPHKAADGTARIGARLLEQAVQANIPVLKSRERLQCRRVPAPPTIDGILDDWPETPVLELTPDRADTVHISESYSGAGDCSARVGVAWDSESFYIAAAVADDTHFQEESGFQIWRGDCIQLAFRDGPPNPDPGFDGTEHEVGLTLAPDATPLLFQWMPGKCALREGQLAVARSAGQTVYEAAIPWSALGVTRVAAGRRLSWSVTVNDNDGKGFEGWLEWTPGVCGSKDSSAFGWLMLAGAE